MAVSYEQARRFYAAIRAERLDLGDAARRSGLKFHEAAEVFAKGVAAGRLEVRDDFPGFRYIWDKNNAPQA